TRSSPLFTRPAYSSMSLGLVPAASTRDGASINSGMCRKSLGFPAMSVTDDFLRNNASYAASEHQGGLPTSPASQVAVVSCNDLDAAVRNSMNRIRSSPFIPHREVRGFVFDVTSGQLREVR